MIYPWSHPIPLLKAALLCCLPFRYFIILSSLSRSHLVSRDDTHLIWEQLLICAQWDKYLLWCWRLTVECPLPAALTHLSFCSPWSVIRGLLPLPRHLARSRIATWNKLPWSKTFETLARTTRRLLPAVGTTRSTTRNSPPKVDYLKLLMY